MNPRSGLHILQLHSGKESAHIYKSYFQFQSSINTLKKTRRPQNPPNSASPLDLIEASSSLFFYVVKVFSLYTLLLYFQEIPCQHSFLFYLCCSGYFHTLKLFLAALHVWLGLGMYNNVGSQPQTLPGAPLPSATPQPNPFGNAFQVAGSGLIRGGLHAYGERIFGSSSEYVQSNVSRIRVLYFNH